MLNQVGKESLSWGSLIRLVFVVNRLHIIKYKLQSQYLFLDDEVVKSETIDLKMNSDVLLANGANTNNQMEFIESKDVSKTAGRFSKKSYHFFCNKFFNCHREFLSQPLHHVS